MTDKRLKPEESLKDEWQELEAYFNGESVEKAPETESTLI